jgi:hypothetical protein
MLSELMQPAGLEEAVAAKGPHPDPPRASGGGKLTSILPELIQPAGVEEAGPPP